jgi:hypothetical protein
MLTRAAVALLTWSIVTAFPAAMAAPLPPLSEITPIAAPKLYFAPDKITAVYPSYIYAVTHGHKPTNINVHQGPLKPYVSGVDVTDFAIDIDATTFLSNLHLLDKFVDLHSVGGDMYLKASSVLSISAPYGTGIDPRVKAFVYPGLTTPGGTKVPWQVFETPEKVKDLVDTIRTRADAGDM